MILTNMYRHLIDTINASNTLVGIDLNKKVN